AGKVGELVFPDKMAARVELDHKAVEARVGPLARERLRTERRGVLEGSRDVHVAQAVDGDAGGTVIEQTTHSFRPEARAAGRGKLGDPGVFTTEAVQVDLVRNRVEIDSPGVEAGGIHVAGGIVGDRQAVVVQQAAGADGEAGGHGAILQRFNGRQVTFAWAAPFAHR